MNIHELSKIFLNEELVSTICNLEIYSYNSTDAIHEDNLNGTIVELTMKMKRQTSDHILSAKEKVSYEASVMLDQLGLHEGWGVVDSNWLKGGSEENEVYQLHYQIDKTGLEFEDEDKEKAFWSLMTDTLFTIQTIDDEYCMVTLDIPFSDRSSYALNQVDVDYVIRLQKSIGSQVKEWDG